MERIVFRSAESGGSRLLHGMLVRLDVMTLLQKV